MVNTVDGIRMLCAAGATVVWSHILLWPDLADRVQRLFDSGDYAEFRVDLINVHRGAATWTVGSAAVVSGRP